MFKTKQYRLALSNIYLKFCFVYTNYSTNVLPHFLFQYTELAGPKVRQLHPHLYHFIGGHAPNMCICKPRRNILTMHALHLNRIPISCMLQ